MNSTPESFVVLRDHLPLPRAYLAPRTDTEITLEKIWRTALSMDCVGVNDSYQDLGGDSFLATVIFTMIEAAVGAPIPMAFLVESPTIAELATKIDQYRSCR